MAPVRCVLRIVTKEQVTWGETELRRAATPSLLPAASASTGTLFSQPPFSAVFSTIQPWAGSLGITAKTQIKGIVLFLTYTLLILTPTVPSPVLTSGEPLALRAFVSGPKTAAVGEGGKLGETRAWVSAGSRCAEALLSQQQGKGVRGRCTWARLCFQMVSSCGAKPQADGVGLLLG